VEGSRSGLHQLLMRLPAAISILRGPQLRYTFINEDCGHLLRREAMGRPIREVFPELEGVGVFESLDHVYATGEPYFCPETTRFIGADSGGKRYFNVVYQPMRGDSGDIDGVITFAFEVTDQVLARQRIEMLAADLKRAEATATLHADTEASLNDLSHKIAATRDLDVMVQAITDVATRLTGAQFGAFFYNVSDDRGGWYTLFAISGVPREKFEKFPMPRNTDVFAPTFLGEGPVRSDDITKDPRYGHNAPYHGMPEGHLPVRSYLAAPVVSRSTEVIGGLFFGHNEIGVFDARDQQIAVRIAEKAALAIDNVRLYEDAQRLIRRLEVSNRELDQFAYVASHDLKAPLRGISSLAEWIEEDLGAAVTDDARGKLDLLRRRVHRMEALIQGILDFSRIGRTTGRREEIQVKRLLSDVIDLIAPTPPRSITVADDMPTVTTERVALQQVFLNLLSNGLKHAERPDGHVHVEARDAGEQWEFRVTDNGPGIAPEFQERVWGIFQTLQARDKVESTGIGLAIVKKVVEARGGRTWIESPEGAGATFCFTWPKAEDRR
jgi:signal transduction histidine kinase